MKTIALAASMLVATEAAEFGFDTFYPSYGTGYKGQSYSHGHSHSHSHDDDDDDSDVDKSTWYNKYQQYSPIKVAYKPTTGSKRVYATCMFSADSQIQLAQLPGDSVQAKVNIRGATADQAYAIRVF